jgi:hypothetical protein
MKQVITLSVLVILGLLLVFLVPRFLNEPSPSMSPLAIAPENKPTSHVPDSSVASEKKPTVLEKKADMPLVLDNSRRPDELYYLDPKSQDIELPKTFAFSRGEANVEFSIRAYAGIGTVGYSGDLKLSLDGRDDLFVNAHRGSVFRGEKDKLYFADFNLRTVGGLVAAYDLSTGKMLWRTRLRAGGRPELHSVYRNEVTMDLSPKYVTVTGKESYRDYVEVLDRKTGEVLAYKVYRMGF